MAKETKNNAGNAGDDNPKETKKETKKEVLKAESVVNKVKRTKTITSKQLAAYQKETLGKAKVEKSKTNNGN